MAILTGWLVTNQTTAQQDHQNPQTAKIKALLQQRCDVFQRRYELLKQTRDQGSLPIEDVIMSNDDLLKSKLELASSKQERLKICNQRVDNLKKLEQAMETRVQVGKSSWNKS